jgi:threonine-phosphate decarboxylase
MGVSMPTGKIIDFSTNTNVLPWKGWDGLKLNLRRSLTSYPDDEATDLRQIVAEREGRVVKNCSIENVLVVNGSNEAIYLVASLLAGKRAVILQPAYGEYFRALSAFGAKVCNVFETGDLPADAEALFLCNPCNPTGKYLERGLLEGLIERHPHTLFIVDEAYVDFLIFPTFLINERRKLDFLCFRNVVILRSLTKIFHLSGVRIGYVLACEERVTQLKSRQPTWSVNAVAQSVALDFMKDEEFICGTRKFYAAETPRFIAEVEKAGFRVLPTRTNFFLIEVADDEKIIRVLLERGLVVRHTRNFPGLDGRYIRVATRAPEENDMLARELRRAAEQMGFSGACAP